MDEHVCRCYLVTKQEIVDAITNDNVRTIEELKSATLAGCGCGKCELMCKHILKTTLSDQLQIDE